MTSKLTQIAMPFTILFESAKPVLEIGRRSTQLLYGEAFEIEKADGPFLFGKSKIDGYEGWIHQDSLTDQTWLPTHFVDALWAPVFPKPTFKNWAMVSLPFMARIEIDSEKSENGYHYIPTLRGYVHDNHIKPLSNLTPETDIVETAMRLLEAPYQYAGRSPSGLDCSSLVQLALLRAGYDCPRDTDQQEPVVGKAIDFSNDPENPQNLESGDLVYLPGHVGMMVDEGYIINATARTMQTQIEPLHAFIADYKKQGSVITSIRRL